MASTTLNISGKRGRPRVLKSETTDQRKLRSSGSQNNLRDKNSNIPAPATDIYEFVYDAESEPKSRKKVAKTAPKRRVNQKHTFPRINNSKDLAKVPQKSTVNSAIVRTRNAVKNLKNTPPKSTVNSTVSKTTDRSKDQERTSQNTAVNRAIAQTTPWENAPSKPAEDSAIFPTRNPTKNRGNAPLKLAKDGAVLERVNQSKDQEKLSANRAFAQKRNASKFQENKLEKQDVKSATSKTRNLSEKPEVKSQKLPLTSAVLETASPLGNNALSTPSFGKKLAAHRMQKTINSSTPFPRNQTIIQKTSFGMLSPWRYDESHFDFEPNFSPYRSDLSKSNNLDSKCVESPCMPYQSAGKTTKVVNPVPNSNHSLLVHKRLRLSLSKSFKQATANKQVNQNDPLNFGFDESDDISVPDTISEILPNKDTLNMHRIKARELFSRTAEKQAKLHSGDVNDENKTPLYPHLPLFYDPTEPKSDVEEDLTEEQDVPYMLRKPRVNRCLSLTDSDEESVKHSPKKKSRVGGSNVNVLLDSFAKDFNSMCEEVEQYELIVEPKRD